MSAILTPSTPPIHASSKVALMVWCSVFIAAVVGAAAVVVCQHAGVWPWGDSPWGVLILGGLALHAALGWGFTLYRASFIRRHYLPTEDTPEQRTLQRSLERAIDSAAKQGTDRIHAALRAGADPRSVDEGGIAPVVRAVRQHAPAAVRALVGTPYSRAQMGLPEALLEAVRLNDAISTQILLEAGVDPTTPSSETTSAWEYLLTTTPVVSSRLWVLFWPRVSRQEQIQAEMLFKKLPRGERDAVLAALDIDLPPG